jgi:hypothetical protein
VKSALSSISQIQDAKARRAYQTTIVDEILTKHPFTKLLTTVMLQDTFTEFFKFASEAELSKLARECLKNLTSEDLW